MPETPESEQNLIEYLREKWVPRDKYDLLVEQRDRYAKFIAANVAHFPTEQLDVLTEIYAQQECEEADG